MIARARHRFESKCRSRAAGECGPIAPANRKPFFGWGMAAVILAHAGGSTIWVFSTTLLHFQADDRFRGRMFSADFGFLVLTMSAMSYAGGIAATGVFW